MSEENKMTEENKKTIIAFIAGLLIGGLLVFIFVEPARDAAIDTVDNDNESEMSEDTDDQENDEENDANDEEQDEEQGNAASEDDDDVSSSPVTIVSDGAIEIDDQAAGNVVTLGDVEYPGNGGWIGVRDYDNGQLGSILGVARYNVAEGLTPDSIRLLRGTVEGQTYAVVFYSDNGDRRFNLANDVQLSVGMTTFEAE